MKTNDDYFHDWEASVFGFGYGTGEEYIIPILRRFVLAIPKCGESYKHEALEAEFGPVIAWLLINALCHADVIEYGTSPRFGWLTPIGEKLREYMESKTDEELQDALDRDNDYIACYPDWCNCDGPMCRNPFWRETKERGHS